jgi:membrane-associated HD superfamily phosphohydrolase
MTKFNNETENSPKSSSSFYANDIQQFINEAKLNGNITQESLTELEKLAKNYNKKSSYNFLLRFSSLITALTIFVATINISLKLNNSSQFLFLLLCFVFSSISGFVIKKKNQRIGDSLLFLGSCYMISIFIALVAVASKIQVPYPLYQTEAVTISSFSYFNMAPGIKIVKSFLLF